MTQPGGKLWPLWLFPVLCFIGASLFLDRALQRDDLFDHLVLAWSLFALPAYAVAVSVLRARLKRLPTRGIVLVAVLAAMIIPLVFGACFGVSESAFVNAHLGATSAVVLALAPVLAPALAPVLGMWVAYVTVRRRYPGLTRHAG